MRYYEDFAPGQSYELGSATVDAADITEFAKRWDPQSLHLDAEQAENGPYRGLITSGWHTAAIFMRLYVEHLLNDSSCVGSPGVDDLRWLAPVRPGDTLTASAHIETVHASRTHPERGTVRPRCELRNQHGDVVLRMYLNTLLLRRPTAPDDDSTPGEDRNRKDETDG